MVTIQIEALAETHWRQIVSKRLLLKADNFTDTHQATWSRLKWDIGLSWLAWPLTVKMSKHCYIYCWRIECYSCDKSMTQVILKYVAVRKDIFVGDSLAVTWKYSLFNAGLIWCLICVPVVGVVM